MSSAYLYDDQYVFPTAPAGPTDAQIATLKQRIKDYIANHNHIASRAVMANYIQAQFPGLFTQSLLEQIFDQIQAEYDALRAAAQPGP